MPEPGVGNESDEKKDPPSVTSETPEYLGGKEDKKASDGGPSDPGNTWPSNKDKPADKTETRAAAAVGSDLLAANARIDALEIEALIGKHSELPESLKTWCATQKPDVVKSFLASKPRLTAQRNPTPVVGGDNGQSTGLQGAELEELNKAMGITSGAPDHFVRIPAKDGGGLRIHTVRPSDVRMSRAGEGK